MRSEAQKRADRRLAEKRVSVTFVVNREVNEEAAAKMEYQKKNPEFRELFINWLMGLK